MEGNQPAGARLELMQGGLLEEPRLPRVLSMRDLELRLGDPLGSFPPGHHLAGHWMGAHGFPRPVSVRLIPRTQAESWRRVVRRLANQRHGAYPDVYRLEQWEDYVCAVAEPLAGMSLAQWLTSRRSLSPRRVLALAWQTAWALAWAHERGVAHGNLCESLVWLTPERHVKLLDWGVAGPGSALADCQAYERLFSGLGLSPDTEWANTAEAVRWFEARHRRFSVYERLP